MLLQTLNPRRAESFELFCRREPAGESQPCRRWRVAAQKLSSDLQLTVDDLPAASASWARSPIVNRKSQKLQK
jgi:hypothetical protein